MVAWRPTARIPSDLSKIVMRHRHQFKTSGCQVVRLEPHNLTERANRGMVSTMEEGPPPAAERAADGKRTGKKKKRKAQNNKFAVGAHVEGADEDSGSHRPDGVNGSVGEAAKKKKKVCWVVRRVGGESPKKICWVVQKVRGGGCHVWARTPRRDGMGVAVTCEPT